MIAVKAYYDGHAFIPLEKNCSKTGSRRLSL